MRSKRDTYGFRFRRYRPSRNQSSTKRAPCLKSSGIESGLKEKEMNTLKQVWQNIKSYKNYRIKELGLSFFTSFKEKKYKSILEDCSKRRLEEQPIVSYFLNISVQKCING